MRAKFRWGKKKTEHQLPAHHAARSYGSCPAIHVFLVKVKFLHHSLYIITRAEGGTPVGSCLLNHLLHLFGGNLPAGMHGYNSDSGSNYPYLSVITHSAHMPGLAQQPCAGIWPLLQSSLNCY